MSALHPVRRFTPLALASLMIGACADKNTPLPHEPPDTEQFEVVVLPDSLNLRAGFEQFVWIEVRNENGEVATSPAVAMQSQSPGIASVGPSGEVVAHAAGQTEVVFSVDGDEVHVPVVVRGTEQAPVPEAPVPLSSRPFGLDVSSLGDLFVTQLDAAQVSHFPASSLGSPTAIAVGSVPTAVAFSPQGTRAYVTNQFSSSIGVVRLPVGVQIAEIPVTGDPFQVMVSRRSLLVFASTNIGWVYVINGETYEKLDSINVGGAPNGLAVNRDHSRLYVSTMYGLLAEYSLDSKTLRTFTDSGGLLQELILSADESEIWVADEAGEYEVWDVTTATKIDSLPVPGAFGAAISPDGSIIAVSQPSVGKVTTIDRATRAVLGTIDVGGQPRRLRFAQTGTLLVVANESGWVDFIR